MEDTEKTSESVLLEEAMAETGQSILESDTLDEKDASEAAGDAAAVEATSDRDGELDGTIALGEEEDMTEADNEGQQTESEVEESLGVGMGEISGADIRNNNLTVDDLLNVPASSLGEDDQHSDEPEGTVLSSVEGTIPTSETSLSEQFISQTDNLVVQNEPPQQLMEETDMIGEEGQDSNDDLSTAAAEEMDTSGNALPSSEEEKQPEESHSDVDAAMLLEQGATTDAVDLADLQDELDVHLGANQLEEQTSQQLDGAEETSPTDMQGSEVLPTMDMQEAEDLPAEGAHCTDELSSDTHGMEDLAADRLQDPGELSADGLQDAGELPADDAQDTDELPADDLHDTEALPSDDIRCTEELTSDIKNEDNNEAMELPVGENKCDAAVGAENFAILTGGDHVEGSIGDLGGKILLGSDGSVHLLGGQETLQGMQLMEEDDKPEDEVAALQGEDAQRELQDQLRAALLQGEVARKELQDQLQAALLKEEEMKQELDEESNKPEAESVSDSQSNAESDALATLASAALGHQAPTNGVKSESETPEVKKERDEPQWMDVGICKGTHCTVRTYYIPNDGQTWDKNWEGITTNTLPDHRAFAKLELEAGKAYKFRVAAINSCGRGPWSEISAFRTCMPGVPGAPSAIKISKTIDGAHLSWEPPSTASGHIEDYTVYMAVRNATTDSSQVVSSGANQLAFVRIYQGPENQCSVNNDTLTEAHIDTTTKPAILFRIAARNEKGLGPAIQVRWLQDVGVSNVAKPAFPPKRPGPELKAHTSAKRKCD